MSYKLESRGFDSRRCYWNFSLTPSGRTRALGSTQPLTEMSTWNIFWEGKGGRYCELTTLPFSCADFF